MRTINPEGLLVIDIETASSFPAYRGMDEHWQKLWDDKVARTLPEGTGPEAFYPARAGVMAEFAKIICISIGIFHREEKLELKLQSFCGHDEKELLTEFLDALEQLSANRKRWSFAGHNIKEFDIPFICRRLIINGMALPAYLDFQQMKPWETNIIDSFQYWRFGDYKNYTSLNLLAGALQVPSSKDDIDGSMVGGLYWEPDLQEREANLKRIVTYCEKDMVTTANILLRFIQQPLLNASEITVAPKKNKINSQVST